MSTAQSIREYFLLSEAQATAKRLGEEHRGAVARRLQLGRQRAEAADALWSNGHTAEGLRLGAEAFEETLGAVSGLAEALDLPEPVKAPPKAEPAKAEPAKVAEAEEEKAEAEEEKAEEEKPEEEKADEEKPEAKEEKAEAKEEKAAEAEEEAPQAKAEEKPAEEGPEAKAEEKPAEEVPEAEAAEAPPEAEEKPVAKLEEQPEAAPAKTQEPVWARALRARGLSDRKLRAVREADEALRKTELPPLDDDVSPTHAELFQQLAAARRHADRVLAPAAMSASQLTWTRISRFAVLGAVSLIAILAIYFAVRTPDETTAIASAVYANHADYQPEMAIDGDPESEWLLPDHQTGWLEVRLSPPERVGTLRLRNTHNRQYNDRATKDYTVEIYSGGAVVRTIQGTWPRLVPNDPPWTEHQLGVDNVERIRFVVRSSHNYGGGLAEIEWR